MPILILLTLALAQEPQRFTSSSELVVLHVSVIDRKSGYLAGLPREAFTVYENGEPQTLGFFENADTPVTVGLVIDSSISMQRRRQAVIAAGISFTESCHPDDEMFTINFNERVWPGLPRGQMFTSDREELRRALMETGARGQTAFFDGVITALAHLDKGSRQKKVLVVVSDGGDNASQSRFDDVLAAALRMDAVVYTVSVKDPYDSDGKPGLLKKLAEVTGGQAFFLQDADQVKPTLERIARDIRSGYTLGYAPAASGEGFRTVKVGVRTPDHRKVVVRARSGYVSGSRHASRKP